MEEQVNVGVLAEMLLMSGWESLAELTPISNASLWLQEMLPIFIENSKGLHGKVTLNIGALFAVSLTSMPKQESLFTS